MLKIFPWGKVKNSLGESQDLLEKTQSIYSVAKNSLMGKTLVIVVKGKKKQTQGGQSTWHNQLWLERVERKKKKRTINSQH